VRLVAEYARHAYPYLSVVAAMYHLHIALAAGAFQLYHISCKIEQADNTYNACSTFGAAVRYGRLFRINYHKISPFRHK
jgi:hypothetical protein